MSDTAIQEKPAPLLDMPAGKPPALREHAPMVSGTHEEARAQLATLPAAIPELTVKKIAGAIAGVMNAVGIVSKQGFNEFHRYRYAAMQDILQKITPLLAEQG